MKAHSPSASDRASARRLIWCPAALLWALILAGCSGGGFDRADAIVAIQTTGVTEAEATCIADSLASLQILDAADPREPRTDERREAFVSATTRCVTPEVLGQSEWAVTQAGQLPDIQASAASNRPEVQAPTAGPGGSSQSEVAESAELAADAVGVLVGQGRAFENAQCIVDQLVATGGEYVFLDQNFGLGLDPLEANAIAACL